ncbi:hypothetical protein [Streptomyces boluensis]|uniref:Uncharacterized protein n=1 Tax=Streptomyces boluensis TaxID=1775135 RepID=A0A964UP02_9ACTN|nr:hypothetical protein [Streptomyces boluensis]NBE51901.1 hypothetical protein [Streptomyces boluensis]
MSPTTTASTVRRTRRPSGFVSGLVLAFACILLFVSLPNLGNVARAATAEGVAGTFTAGQLTCVRHPGHETCEWTGTFESAGGTLRRDPTTLYGSGRESLKEGQRVKAVDVGNAGRVYSPEGSHEWIFTALLLLTGYGLLAWLARRHLTPGPGPSRT